MATQLFLRDEVSDTHLATDNLNLLSSAVGWVSKALATTRGAGVIASDNVATVTGATAGITITKTTAVEWISPPVSADVTIAGTITGNVWAAESSMSANVSICMVIEVIRANATATRNSNTLVEIARRAPGTELALTTRAVNNFTMTPTSTVVNRGDRIRIRLFGDDVTGGVNMATGFTFNASWSGTAGAADGDTYVTFTENFSFESAPGTTALAVTDRTSAEAIGYTGTGVLAVGQEFTAQTDTLTEVRVVLHKNAAPTDNVILEIQTDSSGSASGTVVGTVATVAGTSYTTTATEYTYSTSISLTASSTYHLVIRRSGANDATNNYVATTGSLGALVAHRHLISTTWGAGSPTNAPLTSRFTFTSPTTVLYLTNAQSGLTAAPALLSSFTGSDENPLSEGGNWAAINSSLPGNVLQRLSNQAASASGLGTSYWTPANFGPDLDVYVTLSVASLNSAGIVARIQGEGGAGTWDGYRVIVTTSTTEISVITNATATALLAVSTTWASGDKIGMRIAGSTIQAWRQASGSSDWNLVCTAVNTTYASAGKIGLLAQGTARLDDFYAATDSNLFTQKAWTSRGAGVVSYISDTDAGWTAPLYTHDWYTPGLQAFTLTGMAQANIRALESNASANASLRCELARVNSDGTSPTVWASWCCAPTGTDNGELTTSEVARTINVSGDDLAFTDGQRIRIRLYNEDISSAAMGNAFNVQRFYNGTSGGASGDSYITLAQTVSEYTGVVAVPPRYGFVNMVDPGVL